MAGHVRAMVPQEAVAERAQKFFQVYGDALELVCALPVMNRLRCVSQLGAKYNTVAHPLTMPVEVNGALAQLRPVPLMSRWQHSRAVAAHAIAIGLRLGWEHKRVLESALGALCHDLGHPMFSHVVEPVLARYGLPNHEASGQALVQTDARLRSLLAHLDVSADRVVAVMAEQGDAGAVQNVADTLAYVEHDSMVTGSSLHIDRFSQQVVEVIEGVVHGVLYVREMTPLAQLLSQRAGLSVFLYEHPVNRMCNAALVALCEYLIVHGHLTPEQVAHGIDADLWSAVDSHNGSVPDWVASIAALLRGAPEELARWGLKPGVDTSAFYGAGTLHAPHLGRKSYRVMLPSGLDHTLRTDPAMLPKHLGFQYTLVFLG
jgi:hypothetical protein